MVDTKSHKNEANDEMPIEKFVCFVSNIGHKAKEIVNTAMGLFKKFNSDIFHCRDQSYNNASNMSGVYAGVQARIKQVDPLAEYVPCSTHSLNLIGQF